MKKNTHTDVCHICGKNAKLTFEHIPPKNALNSQRAIAYNGNEMMNKYNGKPSQYMNMQQGMGKYTLCENCNNITGSWYADAYCKVANEIAFSLQDIPLKHGVTIRSFYKNMPVLPFVKQIIAMFCSLIPYEEVNRLGFNRLLLEKESNYVNTELFDLRMYYTPMKTGQIYSGITTLLFKNDNNEVEAANLVDLAAYPFGFILNLTPETNIPYGISINKLFNFSYDDTCDITIPLTYIERYNEDAPLPTVFKPLPIKNNDD